MDARRIRSGQSITEMERETMSHQRLALARRVGEALSRRGWMLVTAESCTGGWVAQEVTAIIGSSRWFDRGFVTYSNEAKQEVLGVEAATLAEHGAVSAEVVREMAEGALRASRAQISLAVSGVAGPGGGTAEKPVGTVWFAWARAGAETTTCRTRLGGDRRAVRHQAVLQALQGVLDRLSALP